MSKTVATKPGKLAKLGDAEAATMDLDDRGPLAPLVGAPLDGPQATGGKQFFQSDDGRISTGIWECGPGRFRAEFGNDGEFVHVVAGEMTCIEDDGTSTTLGPGDSMTFPPGWMGEWRLPVTMRKLYTTFKT